MGIYSFPLIENPQSPAPKQRSLSEKEMLKLRIQADPKAFGGADQYGLVRIRTLDHSGRPVDEFYQADPKARMAWMDPWKKEPRLQTRIHVEPKYYGDLEYVTDGSKRAEYLVTRREVKR